MGDPGTTRAPAASPDRLERQLVRIRWFGVAFGLFQVWQDASASPAPPTASLTAAYALVCFLGLGNVCVWAALQRKRPRLARIGVAAFALDIAVVLGLTWAYSFDQHGTTWILLYVLSLEGAMRARLLGAFVPVGLALGSEIAREVYRTTLFPDYEFEVSAVSFRVGVMAIVAMVAGAMARNLARQAADAERRARAFEDLARKEAASRRELSAFHSTVLAGIAGSDPPTALQSMADAIGRHLQFESLCILTPREDGLGVSAAHGPDPVRDDELRHPDALPRRAAAGGMPLMGEGAREMAAPMLIGSEGIGVLHVRAREEGTFGDRDLATLGRLAAQVALVTYHALLHAERAETVARLRELGEMRADFVAVTSHELRTPLTGIRGFASLLLESYERLSTDEILEFLRTIDEQSRRLSRLVEDLLVVSRLDGGKRLRVEAADVDVEGFLDRIAASFAEDRERIVLHTAGAPEAARFDPDRMEQVLRNLVDNALKFSQEDVTITARTTGGTLELEVSDRGVGIGPNELDSVFERFYQAGRAPEGGGVGLGLYIARRLTEAMGGELVVESESGVGTAFRLVLPQPAVVSA